MITPKQGMSPFQLEQARKKLTYERMTAKTPMVGPVQKAKAKVVALTQMIPLKKVKEEFKNIRNMIIPIIPQWLLQLEDEEDKNYIVERDDVEYIVEKEDLNDWNYLLKRFDSLMTGLMKLLNNIRKVSYAKVIDNKLLEQEIVNRHVRIKEFILEKRPKDDGENFEKKERVKQKRNFLQDLLNIGIAMGSQALIGALSDDQPVEQNVQSLGSFKGGSLQDMTDEDFSDLSYVVSHEALRGTDDEYAVAAAVLNRVSDPRYPNTIMGVGTAPGQFEAVFTGKAYRDPDLAEKLKNNQSSIVSALNALQGRTDFKASSSMSQYMGASDIMFAPGGNFYHYAEQKSKSDPIPKNIPQDWKKLLGPSTKPKPSTQSYSGGAFVVPNLLEQHKVQYNTKNIYDDIGKFIVDRPTVIDVGAIKEPLIIIPLERPIGQEILKSLFDRPFQKIEDIIKISGLGVQKEQEDALKMIEDEIGDGTEDNEQELDELSKLVKIIEADVEDFRKVEESQIENFIPILSAPPELQESKKTNIDTISETTEDPFSQIIILTQDIIVDN